MASNKKGVAQKLRNDLKRAIHTSYLGNMAQLKKFYKEEWSKIPPGCGASLIWKLPEPVTRSAQLRKIQKEV